MHGGNAVTDGMVASYLAKYATKSTEITGHTSARITDHTIDLYSDPDGNHAERLIDACWRLGREPGYDSLRRWAHMLGFGGHFLTKGRRYSVSFGRRSLSESTATIEAAQAWIGVMSDMAGAGVDLAMAVKPWPIMVKA